MFQRITCSFFSSLRQYAGEGQIDGAPDAIEICVIPPRSIKGPGMNQGSRDLSVNRSTAERFCSAADSFTRGEHGFLERRNEAISDEFRVVPGRHRLRHAIETGIDRRFIPQALGQCADGRPKARV